VQALGVDLKDGGSVLEAVVKAVSVSGGQAGVDGVECEGRAWYVLAGEEHLDAMLAQLVGHDAN